MWKDPVVEEVRAAGKRIVADAGNNLHTLCERLREAEKGHQKRVVARTPKKIVPAGGR